jgi:hypothetical protein
VRDNLQPITDHHPCELATVEAQPRFCTKANLHAAGAIARSLILLIDAMKKSIKLTLIQLRIVGRPIEPDILQADPRVHHHQIPNQIADLIPVNLILLLSEWVPMSLSTRQSKTPWLKAIDKQSFEKLRV